VWGIVEAGGHKALLLCDHRWKYPAGHGLVLLDGWHYRRHDWLHLCARGDDVADGDGVEGRAGEALREAVQLRVFREECCHALLELCDLGQLAELSLVVVEESEDGLRPVDVLRLGGQLADDGLEHGASIYPC
jgi:hypothetical protein